MRAKKCLWALAALVLASAGVHASVNAEPAEPPIAADTPTSASGRPLSESYLIKQIQVDIAKSLWDQIQWFIGSTGATYDPTADSATTWACALDSDEWTPDNQTIRWTIGDQQQFTCMTLTFKNPVYTDDTELVYGTPRVVTGVDQDLGSKAARVNNRGRETTTHEVESSFDITQSVESTFTQDFSFDVTVSNKTTISEGSEEAGGKFEDKLTATFGSHFGQSKSRTQAQATDQTDTIKDEIPIDADDDVLITFSNAPITTHVPFSVDGYIDFEIDLILPGAWDWAFGDTGGFALNKAWRDCFATDHNPGWKNRGRHRTGQDTSESVGPTSTFSFNTLGEFMDIWWGVSTDWPLLAPERGCVPDWWHDPATQHSLTAIEDVQRRKIVMSGTQTRTSKTATTMTITSLGDCSLSDADGITADAKEGKDSSVNCAKDLRSTADHTQRAPAKTAGGDSDGGNDG